VVGFCFRNDTAVSRESPVLKGCSIVGVIWGNFAEREPQKKS